MVSAVSAPGQEERVSGHRLLWVGPLAIVASVIANQIVRIIAVSLFNISPEFMALQVGPPLMFTIMGVLVLFVGLVYIVVAEVSGAAERDAQAA